MTDRERRGRVGPPAARRPNHTHRIDIRYGECDQQGVVFNANYLAYVDDTMDHWMRSLPLPGGESPWVGTWDVMLKTATITWHGPARWPETLAVDCVVQRWGTTSFDVHFGCRVGPRAVAEVVITYVSVSPTTHEPMATPELVREAMSGARPPAPGGR